MSSPLRSSSLLAPFCYTARYHCSIKATEPQHIEAGPNPSLPPSRATAKATASSPIRRPLDSSLKSQCFLDSLLVSPAFLYTAPFPSCLLQTPSKLNQISHPGTVAFVAQASLCTESHSSPQPRLNQRYKCDYSP